MMGKKLHTHNGGGVNARIMKAIHHLIEVGGALIGGALGRRQQILAHPEENQPQLCPSQAESDRFRSVNFIVLIIKYF
jgi:hypothetical protein